MRRSRARRNDHVRFITMTTEHKSPGVYMLLCAWFPGVVVAVVHEFESDVPLHWRSERRGEMRERVCVCALLVMWPHLHSHTRTHTKLKHCICSVRINYGASLLLSTLVYCVLGLTHTRATYARIYTTNKHTRGTQENPTAAARRKHTHTQQHRRRQLDAHIACH